MNVLTAVDRLALLSWSSRGPAVNCARAASKKAGGTSKSKSSRSGRTHFYGIKVMDGQLIPAGTMLAKQRLLKTHPGENVKVGKSGNLHALVDGTVVVTWERFRPQSNHYWIERAYSEYDPAEPMLKKYFHVVPAPRPHKFRLIERV